MKKIVPIAPKVVQKGKLGRPPAPKTENIPIAPLPAVIDTKSTTVEIVRRKNYDSEVSKEMMEKALLAVIQNGSEKYSFTEKYIPIFYVEVKQ